MPWCASQPGQLKSSIPPGSVNKNQLCLGRKRQVWFVTLVDERGVCTVQQKLWDPREREPCLRGLEVCSWRGAILFYVYLPDNHHSLDVVCPKDRLIDWVRFNVPPTQYRSYGDRFLQVKWPNQQCQSTEETHKTLNQIEQSSTIHLN